MTTVYRAFKMGNTGFIYNYHNKVVGKSLRTKLSGAEVKINSLKRHSSRVEITELSDVFAKMFVFLKRI